MKIASKMNSAHVPMLQDKKDKSTRSVPRGNQGGEEEPIEKMDSFEFLLTAGGVVILGSAIYLLSFLNV